MTGTRGRRRGFASRVDCLLERTAGRGHGLCLYETSAELWRAADGRKEMTVEMQERSLNHLTKAIFST